MRAFLALGFALVADLFGAFGGFVARISPPEVPGVGLHVGFAVGLASFVSLLIALQLHALASRGSRTSAARAIWLVVGAATGLAFVAVALRYDEEVEARTFLVVDDSTNKAALYMTGDVYTPAAKTYLKTTPDASPVDLILGTHSSDATAVWTRSSLVKVEGQMIRWYQLLVVLLSVSIFCTTECLVMQTVSNGELSRAAGP